MPVDMRAIWQRNYTEMLWQLALFPSGRDAMQQEAAVLKALEEVRERGMTVEAREHAAGALMALSDREMHASVSGEPRHIMLSYQVRLQLPSPTLGLLNAHHRLLCPLRSGTRKR